MLIIDRIVAQHAEESAFLWLMRDRALRQPHYSLGDLRKLDDRIAAHIDGLRVAGPHGAKYSMMALDSPGPGEMFTASVLALEDKDPDRLDSLFAMATGIPKTRKGLVSALGWVSSHYLQGTVQQLLCSAVPFCRAVGITACVMHCLSPGNGLHEALENPDAWLRGRALRACGELGNREAVPRIRAHLSSSDEHSRFWAAWAAVLLGERGEAVDALSDISLRRGPYRFRAARLVLQALSVVDAHELLRRCAHDRNDQRTLIQGAGIVGDPKYVPWLIKNMEDLELSRLAGEAFSTITGVDLALRDLELKPPNDGETVLSEAAGGEDAATNPDDNLPWPDAYKVAAWWTANSQAFEPGKRYFAGTRVSPGSCARVLREGYQRQRVAAAECLCVLQPGGKLFPTSAPAWRQQRWLQNLRE